MKILRGARIIEVRRHPPRWLEPLRRFSPRGVPRDPGSMWLLVIRHRAHLRFTAAPLFIGPREPEALRIGAITSDTSITGRSGRTHRPEVLYQTVRVKPSWRRHGISSTLLLRLHAHFAAEGSPVLVGSFTASGWALAAHMRDAHGWEIDGGPPEAPTSQNPPRNK